MVGKYAKKFCNEDISLIENYAKAIADSTQIWECHHRRENIYSKKELLEKNEYYNRPACELIFLTKSEHRALPHKGKHRSEETKRKISEARKGMKLSEEARRKMSEAQKGKIFTEEHKRKIAEARKGKHHTEEARRKMSIAKKNMSEETKRKMSIAKKNMSEETKRKLADAMKRLHWFNNGIKNVFVKECPAGFVRGRLTRLSLKY